jgi:DNA polymerase-3 subunit delta
MAQTVDALEYLAHPEKHPAPAVCVLFGDEPFLQRQALAKLRQQVVPSEDGEFSVAVLAGDEIELREVFDELSTGSLFGGGQRLVIVEEADDFVSRHRAALEQYVARPKRSAVLVLLVKTWPGTTRLAKAVVETGLPIECKCPPPARLAKWLVAWAKQQHQARLEPGAAEVLIEHVEPDLGLLDQELAKLASLAGTAGPITAELVDQAVGGWRAKTAWDLLDAALNGQTSEALIQLDRLLLSGEVPIALMGQVGASLRRMAAAVRLLEQAELTGRRSSLRQALEQAGVKPFVLAKAESQLRRLGRVRAGQLYHWLLEADLALKGTSSSPGRARLLLEEFVVRLSAPQSETQRPAAAHASGRRG